MEEKLLLLRGVHPVANLLKVLWGKLRGQTRGKYFEGE